MIEKLHELNPWWSGKEFEAGIIREDYLKKIKLYSSSNEIVILNGVRRSGKTTLLLQTIKSLIDEGIDPKKIFFVKLDSPFFSSKKETILKILEEYQNNIYQGEDAYLFFDEVQSIDGWEREIKYLYDLKKYKIFVSGSTSHLLETKLATLLSGRYLQIKVFPLNFKEYLLFQNLDIDFSDKLSVISNKRKILFNFNNYLKEGGFPKPVLEKNEIFKKDMLINYFDAIVYKDIVLLNNIRNLQSLKEILYYIFTNFSSLYSKNALAKLFKIDYNSLRDYIGYCFNAYLIFEIPIFNYSLKAQSRNNKKIYCIDNGLRNAVSFKFSSDFGKLAENLVFIELVRRENIIYYWQNEKHKEVDFVLKNKDQSLSAINVCYSNEIHERETEGLVEFKNKFGKKVKELIILTKDLEKEERIEKIKVKFIPLWKWLIKDNRGFSF